MKVYLVERVGWDWVEIEGAYTAREDAERHVEQAVRKKDLDIIEREVWEEFSKDRFTKSGQVRAEYWRHG